MGSKHPEKTKINTPSFPIYSIMKAAKAWDVIKENDESKALLDWALRMCSHFTDGLEAMTEKDQKIYQFVESNFNLKLIATKTIVDGLADLATETGIRGGLSRLVKYGLLVRPKKGFYWPAGVAYKPEWLIEKGE